MLGWLVRFVVAVISFAAVTYFGLVVFGDFSRTETAVTSWAVTAALALVVAFVVYAALEFLQTDDVESITRQFDTRTIVLMPLAIGINIVLGAAVASALKLPIYLDSTGTILVGVLAGPIPGAITGVLTNVLWTYVVPPPFQSSPAAAFAVVAAIIGILAGLAGRFTLMRPRRNRPLWQVVLAGVMTVGLVGGAVGAGYYTYSRFVDTPNAVPTGGETALVILGWVVVVLLALAVIGLLALLVIRRDLTVVNVVLAGIITGVVAALVSAPISANLFSGVTGAGTDFVVAAFRSAGASIQQATLGQGLISDPIDKVATFFVVYLVLQAMPRRLIARFPQGDRVAAPERAHRDDAGGEGQVDASPASDTTAEESGSTEEPLAVLEPAPAEDRG